MQDFLNISSIFELAVEHLLDQVPLLVILHVVNELPVEYVTQYSQFSHSLLEIKVLIKLSRKHIFNLSDIRIRCILL